MEEGGDMEEEGGPPADTPQPPRDSASPPEPPPDTQNGMNGFRNDA
jgi:penicillin-binding protein 1A